MKKLICLDGARCGPWTMERLGVEDFVDWKSGLTQCIGLIEVAEDGTERQIAGVLFNEFNHASIQMHVAAEPGARWMTKEYLGFCFRYPFVQCRVKKILGYVGSKNLQAQRFDTHLGFREEARIVDAHQDGELIIYSMTADQCRWLNIPIPEEVMYGKR